MFSDVLWHFESKRAPVPVGFGFPADFLRSPETGAFKTAVRKGVQDWSRTGL
jgi:hypothetical protein